MSELTFIEELEELSAAEEFLDYFEIEYDASKVFVNRLHILQRYHDYLEQAREAMPETELAQKAVYAKLLQRAYDDFVDSDAQTEKVLKVYKMQEPSSTFVSLDDVFK